MYGGYYDGYSNNNKQGKGFDCVINNNNNTNIVLTGGAEDNQTTPPTPPESTTATLKVTKQITCVDQIEGDCEDLLEVINESRFPLQVEGNNPDPSSPFPGSPTGTDVTLGPGNYVVIETIEESVIDDFLNFLDNHEDPPRILSVTPDFSGDCTPDIGEITEIQANGRISAGELQTCNALNDFNITIGVTS